MKEDIDYSAYMTEGTAALKKKVGGSGNAYIFIETSLQ